MIAFQQVLALLQALESDQLDMFYQLLSALSYARFPGYRKAEEKEVAQQMQANAGTSESTIWTI